MRRLALLLAGGALWILLGAAPVFADGGPHDLTLNSGTSGLNGDCAACHRAHTAQAADLLKVSEATLCESCHNGTGATTDVIDGVQFAPTTWTGTPASDPVLGALRGGGFDTALIGDPARLSYQSGSFVRNLGHVGVGTAQTVTSTHLGTGTVWGNGAINSGAGVTGVTLECTSCHNPHGNGQYRILHTGKSGDTLGATDWTGFGPAVSGGVQVQDVGSTSSTKNYTVLPGAQASDVVTAGYTASQGDYWRSKYETNATPAVPTSWTTSSSLADPLQRAWQSYTTSYVNASGTQWLFRYPVNASEIATYNAALLAAGKNDPWTGTNSITQLDNRGGLMTAWCIQCHSRYNGQPTVTGTAPSQATSPSSLTAYDGDSIFMYKHGTTRYGCEQCHVSHGTSVTMDTASQILNPGGAVLENSALLKVDNRGTCNMCHDPTGTVTAGTYVGPTPTPGWP